MLGTLLVQAATNATFIWKDHDFRLPKFPVKKNSVKFLMSIPKSDYAQIGRFDDTEALSGEIHYIVLVSYKDFEHITEMLHSAPAVCGLGQVHLGGCTLLRRRYNFWWQRYVICTYNGSWK